MTSKAVEEHTFYTSHILKNLDLCELKEVRKRCMNKFETTETMRFSWIADRISVELNRRYYYGR